MTALEKNTIRVVKVKYLLELLKYEIDFIDKDLTDKEFYRQLNEIRTRSHALKLHLKRKQINYNEVFEDFSNDKIFAIMTVLEKMFYLTESQAQEFENSLEIEIKENISKSLEPYEFMH